MAESRNKIQLTTEIVSSYVRNNIIQSEKLPELIKSVYLSLENSSTINTKLEFEKQKPAVSIKKSVKADYIICLECGQKCKTLKRHLRKAHGLEPQEYRQKWGLPVDYPMVAKSYSIWRSQIAKNARLGKRSS